MSERDATGMQSFACIGQERLEGGGKVQHGANYTTPNTFMVKLACLLHCPTDYLN